MIAPPTPQEIYILQQRAKDCISKGKLVESENYAQELIFLSKKNNYELGIANAYEIIGKCKYLVGDYKGCIDYSIKGIKIAEKYKDKQVLNIALFIQLANSYSFYGNKKDALELFDKALSLVNTSPHHSGITMSLYNSLALFYTELGNLDLALEYYNKCIREFDKEPTNHLSTRNKGLIYNNIGRLFFFRGSYEQALNYHQKSLVLKEKVGDTISILSSYLNLTTIYRNIGNYSEAISYGMKVYEACKEKDTLIEPFISSIINLVNSYLDLKEFQKALDIQEQAITVIEKIDNKEITAVFWMNLGETLVALKRKNEGLNYFKKGFSIAEKAGLKRVITNSKNSISNVFAEIGDYKSAYRFLREYLFEKDELFKKETIDKIDNLNTIHRLEIYKTKTQLIETQHEEYKHRTKNHLEELVAALRAESSIENDRDLRNKVNAINLLYKEIEIKDTTNILMKEYIENVTQYTFQTFSSEDAVKCTIEVSHNLKLEVELAKMLGQVITELVGNALKYAFPTEKIKVKQPQIQIIIKQNLHMLSINVKDNGIGLGTNDFNSISKNSKGLTLIQTYIEDILKGVLQVKSSYKGTHYTIKLNVHEKS